MPDDASEEVAATGQSHHGRVAYALVEGTRGVGYGLYRLQTKERQDEHQQQRRKKHDPQDETPQRVAPCESAVFTSPDVAPPFPSSHLTLSSHSPGCRKDLFPKFTKIRYEPNNLVHDE